jgi:predicted acetyltransferase
MIHNTTAKVESISVDYLDAFQDVLDEFASAGESYTIYEKKLGEWWHNPLEHILFWQRLAEAPMPELQLVKTDSYWPIDGTRILGDVRFRHDLNRSLEREGGHIGYCVRPSERNKGIATTLLKFALNHAHSLGHSKALLTCRKQNFASIKVIEKNGGIFADECLLDDGSVNRRYWIDLQDAGADNAYYLE